MMKTGGREDREQNLLRDLFGFSGFAGFALDATLLLFSFFFGLCFCETWDYYGIYLFFLHFSFVYWRSQVCMVVRLILFCFF